MWPMANDTSSRTTEAGSTNRPSYTHKAHTIRRHIDLCVLEDFPLHRLQ
jgi:hypothetical protein